MTDKNIVHIFAAVSEELVYLLEERLELQEQVSFSIIIISFFVFLFIFLQLYVNFIKEKYSRKAHVFIVK